MRRPILQTLPRDGRADFLRSFYTRFQSGGTAFCAGQPDQLYPVTAVSCLSFIHLHMLRSWRVYFLHRPRPETYVRNGRPITRRPFHTFVLRKKLFLHRPNSGTLPGIGGSQLSVHFTHVARLSISHVFALEKIFSTQGQPVNFTRRRPFPRRPFILHIFFFWRGSFLHRPSSSTAPRDGHPPAHSFITPRFCSGENFFSPEQPINLNRWGSFVPRRSLPAAARFTLQIHFFHDYVRHFRPSSIPSYMPSFRFGRPSQNHPAWLWEPTHITNIAHRKHCSPFRPRCARPDTHIPLSPHRVL